MAVNKGIKRNVDTLLRERAMKLKIDLKIDLSKPSIVPPCVDNCARRDEILKPLNRLHRL